MKWNVIALVAICVVLVAIPATMMVASGEFFPKNQEDYKVAIILPSTDLHGLYISQSLVGAQNAIKESNESDDIRNITVDLKIFDVASDETRDASLGDFENIITTYDLVYAPSYNTINEVYYLADRHPDVSFLLMDNTITTEVNNIADIAFRNEEIAFITGYLAGMTTETNKVGFLGGVTSDTIYEFFYGFSAGVELAEVERGDDIAILSEYVGSYIDRDRGYELTKKMYNSGADVVFTVAGDSGLGGIQAAVDENKYVIGVDVDQNVVAPNNVIFSAVKNIASEVKNVILQYAAGNSSIGNIYVGYADDAIDTVSFLNVVPNSAIKNAKLLEQAIAEGNFTVPKTAEELAKWNVYTAQAAIKFAKNSESTK